MGMARAIAHWGHDVEIYTTNFDGASDLDVPLGMPVRGYLGKGRQSDMCGIAGYVSLGSSAGGSHDGGCRPEARWQRDVG